MNRLRSTRILAVALVLLVGGCAWLGSDNPPGNPEWEREQAERDRYGTILGRDVTLFGVGRRGTEDGGSGQIGVNAFLWRASLETVDFLPLVSADPFGGVIITDWYRPPESPDERFKVTVYILDRALRADGVRVTVFRQIRDADGTWQDAPIEAGTATALEDRILTRARELRVASIAQR